MKPHVTTQPERIYTHALKAQYGRRRSVGPVALALMLATIVASAGLSSCTAFTSAKTPAKTTGSGMLSANLTTVSFGTVGIGKTTTQSVTVTNTGSSTVTIDQTAVTGASFTTGAGTPAATIAPGQSKTIQIQFAPVSAGSAAGGFTVTSDAANSPLTVALVGTGAQPGLAISPATVSFGNVIVGQSGSQPVALTNTSASSVVVNLATVSGSTFGINGLTLPTTIAAGQTVTFNAQFTPTATGGSTGIISLTDNAAGSPQAIILSGSGVTQSSTLTASPASAVFGAVTVGNTGKQTVTLSNSGNASVTVSGATTTGTGFSIIGLTTPLVISAGQGATFTAQFAPTTAGSASGNITIASNASNSALSIALSGSGAAAGQPQISASPSSVPFGNVGVGGSSAKNIVLQNTGNAALTITQASASGTGFSMSGLSMPLTISAGTSASFTATFAPTTTGNASGSISVASNAPGSPMSIPLSGTGVQAQLSASPATFNFGSVQVGSTGSQLITLANGGTANVSITQATSSGAGFSISGLPAGTTIAAGQSASFTAQFSPTSSGNGSGSISILSNAPNSPLTIALSGAGIQAQLGAVPSAAAFGNVSTGNSNSQTISLTNSGTASVVISRATVTGTGFSIAGLNAPVTIATGSNTTFNVVFTPTAAGSASGSVALTSNAPNSPMTIALSGTGVAGTQLLTFSTSSLGFGSVNVGSNSDLSAALTNTGNSSVTISAVNVSGAGFTVSGVSSGETLSGGQSIPVTVQFAPSAAGAVSGTVSLVSNATNSPASMSLSGTGAQQSTHTVGLAWSDSGTVAGYNVYRGTNTGGPYGTKLTVSPITSTQFTDSGLQSGQTYYYVVTAVDSNGVESVFSNQAVASIP
jgi:Abnormal spindle-like microcephaly-assoc'd, ASPM-SPD-2-Hydin